MIKSAIQQLTIGALLKQKRKERKLTIDQVAEAIRIRAEYLDALETAQYHILPSEVYIKGFLKNYARYLGITPDHALALYRRDNHAKVTPIKTELFDDLKNKFKKVVITPNKVVMFVVSVLILGLILYLSTYIGKVLKVPEISLSAPISVTSGEHTITTDQNFVEFIGTTDVVGTKITINGEEVAPSTVQSFVKRYDLSNETNKFIIKAVSAFGRESQIIITVIKGATNNPNTQNSEIQGQISVRENNSRIEIYVDGILRADKTYNKDMTMEYTAYEQLKITSTKTDSFSVTINGVKEDIRGSSVIYEIINGEILKN